LGLWSGSDVGCKPLCAGQLVLTKEASAGHQLRDQPLDHLAAVAAAAMYVAVRHIFQPRASRAEWLGRPRGDVVAAAVWALRPRMAAEQ